MQLKAIQDEAKAYFLLNQGRFDLLTQSLETILADAASRAGVKVHHVSARTKELDKYLEKFDRKRHLVAATDVQDLVGGRIVTLYRSDLKLLEEKLYDVFEVVGTENKIEDAGDDSFGYMSVHYICRLRADLRGPHYNGLHDLYFEVQLRTILMDAWANVSHHIDYKGESSIPQELKKDFNALSALFYVADSSFERFHSESKQSKEAAVADLEDETPKDIALNADTLRATLRRQFPDRLHMNDEEVSEIMEEISKFTDLTTVRALQDVIQRYLSRAEQYEKDRPPSHWNEETDEEEEGDGRYFDGGMLRVLLSIAIPAFAEGRTPFRSGERYASYRGDESEPA
ncbi:hypothetical protein C5E11_05660 [Clavibacter michiganensis]|nr:hypothetical protein [Clavibacter michiganensis]PPF64175.1 hypothetical protein C5E11_05660 [Clavibacter michiganensis]